MGIYIIINNNIIDTLNKDEDYETIKKSIYEQKEYLKSFPQYEQK